MNEPDDRELEKYLKGDSKLSRLYREGSTERAPPELDEAILAHARREVRARPGLNRVLAPVALAASLILGVNLAWNLHQAEPVPAAPAPPALAKADAPAKALRESDAPQEQGRLEQKRQLAAQAQDVMQAREEDRSAQKKEREAAAEYERANMAAAERSKMATADARPAPEPSPAAAPPAAMSAPQAAGGASRGAVQPAPLGEAQKIDRLIAYIGALKGAVFIRNGSEYGPDAAAKHLQLKREKAGDRVKTAEDFIKLCASHSYISGEAYLIRFPDGRTRTAEDVLREELAKY